ncbi:hypothetical protein K501DRAFT_280984, partial [Backusella circina FSU 941]
IGNESATSSGASTPNMASPMSNPVLYAAANNNAAVRSNGLPIHYQAFSAPSHYDPFHGVTYPQGQMMPQAYMVPAAAIQQMYSAANPPVLSYSGTMNMLSSQQATAQAAIQPTSSQAEDDDEEGNKLSILSRLCSEVLDNNDGTKQENVKSESHQNTPPPSRPHSRETSHDNEGNHHPVPPAAHNNFVNGSHLAHNNVIYGTPGSSPSDSSADTKFVKTENQQQQQQQQHWALSSVQSNHTQ